MIRCELCELCETTGGELIWLDPHCRVVRVDGQEGLDYPGFCLVIWRDHVREMTDLQAADRQHLLHVVLAVEELVREVYRPEKINLASLGNLTPHLHWHVIPRYADDCCFPSPIWAAPRRDSRAALHNPSILAQVLHDRLQVVLAQTGKDHCR
jgi:diadenosine tetraphosphate (Ap4A) HIT family hydrolase